VERDILKSKIVVKALVMKDFLTIVHYKSFSKVPEMGKSLLLESEEKEKCINVKPSYTLPQDIQEK
jgi:hypothetical protein